MALVYQNLTLEVTPGMIPPVLHVTEYDANMQIDVTFTQRGQPFEVPSGTTAKVEGTLAGHPFRKNCTVNGNTVTFILSENMTAYAGRAWTKIVLTKDSWPVSTCGFWLDCDRAGVEADTVIGADGFQEQINQAVAEYIEDSGLIIDSTLSRQGAAADAKAVGDAIKNNLASEYDPALYYAAGNYVVHDNKLYRARAEIVPEAWNEAHWIRAPLADRVFELENAQIETDPTLTIEGAAADAKATGDVVEHIGLETVYTGIESDAPNIPINYSANKTAAGITSQNGKYYSNTTGELLAAGSGSYYSLFRYKPGSVFKADYGINFVFFDVNKHFNYSVPAVSEGAQDITAPGTEGYVGISCQSSYGLNYQNVYARWVYTNFLVTGIDYKISAQTDWEKVYNKRSVEEAVDNVQNLSAAFDVYEINAGGGKIRPIRFGQIYTTNPFVNTGSGQSTADLYFYNADKKRIADPSGISTSGISAGGIRIQSGQLRVNPGCRFSVSGTTITATHYYNGTGTYEFPEAPAYIKIVSSTRWTVGVYSTEIPDGQVVCLYNTEKSSGFAEQMTALIGDSIAAGAGSTAAVLKSQNIMTVNRMRHAFRVGSFNIYGAGYNRRNWSAVRDMLQNYGIDFIGFQEVNQPLSTNSAGQTFQQALTSWQFTQFGVIQTADVPGNCRPVAATSDFEVIGITEVKYTQQSNYGHRHYTRTELQLPKWKDKKWSEYLRVSVYNTQLEAGTSSANTQTRLAQAAELIAAMSADANPFVVLVGDFNEMSPNFSTRQAFVDAGFTPALPDESTCTTAGTSRGYYDNIFVNDRIQIVGNDVVPSDKYKFENGTLDISDHDLVIADIVPDYTNIITVKKNDTQNHCTISGVGNWLDRRQTEPVTVTITPDSGYTFKSVTMYQGDNDVNYGNNPFVINGNTVTIYPSRIVGDIVIVPTCEAS